MGIQETAISDVFISYGREDSEFARRLVTALSERGRQSWVDWRDIEPSDEWWQSVTEAIDAADTVLFIASPDSLVSEICRRELAHAAEQHKRIIAVVSRGVEGLPAPDTVSRVNWIFLRVEDNWDEGLAKLERALDLNIELVRLHTSVLTRAEAWRISGRRPTPLLRGEELRAAEQWVGQAAAGSEPQPTQLQAEFITVSRQMASRRQRRALGGSLTVASIALALAIFAFVQRSQARHQAHVSQSRQLAASAVAQLGSDPEQSITLAVRGLRVLPTIQAVHALWLALQGSRLRADFRGPSPAEAVAFSPDGDELAVGSDDGAVRLWRLSDRRLIWSEGAGGPPPVSLAFAPSGDALVVARSWEPVSGIAGKSGCPVNELSVATGRPERTLAPSGGQLCERFVGFVGAKRMVAIAASDGTVQLLNVDSGSSVRGAVQGMGQSGVPVSGIAISADGHTLALVGLHVVQLVSLDNGRRGATIERTSSGIFNPDAAAFSPDASRLLVGGEYGAEIYGLTSPSTVDLYAQDGSTVSGAWSPDGRLVAAAAGFLGVDVWSSSSRLVEVLHGSSGRGFSAVGFSSKGMLAGAGRDGSVRVWAPDPDLPDRQYAEDVTPTYAYGAAASHLALVGDAHSGVLVVDDSGRKVAQFDPNGDGPFAVTADGELAFTAHGNLNLWRLPAGQPLRSWRLSATNAPVAVAASADGAVAAALSSGGTITLFSGSASRSTTVPISSEGVPRLSISADGRLLAVTVPDGVRVFDTQTMRTVRTLAGTAFSFSSSGKLLAIQHPDLSVAVLHTAGWQPVTTLQGQPAVASVTFSPDDRLVATMGTDGVLRLADATDGTLLGTKQVIESSLVAQRTGSPPVVLTSRGFALVPGANGSGALAAYLVCDQCFNAGALLEQANERLSQIDPVTPAH